MAEKLVGGGGRKIKPKPADRNRSPKRGISFCRVAREGTGDFEPIVWQTSTLTQKAFVNCTLTPCAADPRNFRLVATGCRWNTTLTTVTVSEGIFTFPGVLTISWTPISGPWPEAAAGDGRGRSVYGSCLWHFGSGRAFPHSPLII